MEVGEPPIISFHCPNDGFAPFTQGLVIVPTTQEVVVDVVGSRWAIGQANALGNNDVLYGPTPYNDPYTLAAETALQSNHPSLGLNPADYRGLFPFNRPTIAWPFQESSPWIFGRRILWLLLQAHWLVEPLLKLFMIMALAVALPCHLPKEKPIWILSMDS
jgi:hypothetical protein